MSETQNISQTEVLRKIVAHDASTSIGATRDGICETLGKTEGCINRAIGNLIYRGLIRSAAHSTFEATAAGRKLIAEGGEVKCGPPPGKQQAPRQSKPDSLRVRLWRAVITLKRFTVSELVQAAARPTDKNAIDTARRYLSYLRRAGYLVELPRRQKIGKSTSNGEKVFWLKESFGREAPRVRKGKDGVPGMYDPNDRTYRPFVSEAGKVT